MRVVRRSAQLSGLFQKIEHWLGVVETGLEDRLETLWMAHDPRLVGGVGVVENLCTPALPPPEQILAPAQR